MTLEGAAHVPAGRRDRKGLLHAGPPRRGPNRERGGHRAGRRARSAESTRLLRGRGKGDVHRIASGIVRRPVVSGSLPEPEKRGAPVIGDPTPPTAYRAAPGHTCRYDD